MTCSACPECENPNGIMYDHKLRTWQCVGCGAVWERRETTTQPDRNPAASEEHCPVCGYYCLGKGGHGCIDKPANYASTTRLAVQQSVDRDERGDGGCVRDLPWNKKYRV